MNLTSEILNKAFEYQIKLAIEKLPNHEGGFMIFYIVYHGNEPMVHHTSIEKNSKGVYQFDDVPDKMMDLVFTKMGSGEKLPCFIPKERMKKLPSEWEKETGIKVLDPDGWDRSNFEQSWNTPIDENEWNQRMMVSTCKLNVYES